MKEKKINHAAKSSLAFMFVSFFTQGIGFILTPIVTRILTKGEYGQVSLFNSWYEILGVFAMLCLSFGVFNNGMLEFKKDKNVFMNSLLALSNIATLIVALLTAVLCSFFPNMVGFSKKGLIILFAIFLLQPAYNFWITRNRFEYKYKAVTAICIVSSTLSAVMTVVFIVNLDGDKALLKILGNYLPLLISYLFIYVLIVYRAKGKVKISYWKYALAFNLPLIPHYLSNYVLSGADRIMIDRMCSDEDVAVYSLAYIVASVVGLVWQSINASLVPYTYEKCEKRDFESVGKLVKKLLTVYAVFCGGVLLLLPEAFKILAPGSYNEGIYVAVPVVIGTFLIANYYIFANVVYYYKRPKYVMIASVTAALLNVVLNFIMIPKIGYIAAGYTTMVSYMVQSVIDYYAMKRVSRENDIEKVYDMKFIIRLDLALFIVGMCMNIVYQADILRWSLIGIGLLMVVLFRKRIMSLLK